MQETRIRSTRLADGTPVNLFRSVPSKVEARLRGHADPVIEVRSKPTTLNLPGFGSCPSYTVIAWGRTEEEALTKANASKTR